MSVAKAGQGVQADIRAAESIITHPTVTTEAERGEEMTKAARPKKAKHLPLRTCVSCRETKSKRELLRIVRTPDGHVTIDATGKRSGRGAYLCAKLSCWEQAMKKKRLEQEFEVTISEEDRAGLDAYLATLPKDEPRPPKEQTGKNQSTRKKIPEVPQ
jgi:hypothetical protein